MSTRAASAGGFTLVCLLLAPPAGLGLVVRVTVLVGGRGIERLRLMWPRRRSRGAFRQLP